MRTIHAITSLTWHLYAEDLTPSVVIFRNGASEEIIKVK
jgi:hypothetical protein